MPRLLKALAVRPGYASDHLKLGNMSAVAAVAAQSKEIWDEVKKDPSQGTPSGKG